jgi:uncharacterized membrane protein YhfC
MIQAVPAASIAAMAVNAIIVTLIPIVVFIYINKKTNCKQNSVLVGAGTFVVFALVLETILHQIVFRIFGEKLTGNIWLYALYVGLAAALFEETGRLITMKLFMKKSLTKQNALMLGVGHGGAEALLVGVMGGFSNIVMSIMININQVDKLLATVGENEKDAAVEQLSALSTTPAYEYLLAGAERFLAFVLQICLSYIVYRAVRYKKPLFYILAVAIHFAVDAVLAVLVKIIPVFAVELILTAEVILITVITYKMYRAEKEEQECQAALNTSK